MKISIKISSIANKYLAVLVLIFMLPLCSYSQDSITYSNDSETPLSYFKMLSSGVDKEKFEAISALEKLPASKRNSILKTVYIDNERVFDNNQKRSYLEWALQDIGSIKYAALEEEVYRKLDELLYITEKNPKTRYEVPGFSDELSYYLDLLPYIGRDGDRSFNLLMKHIELHSDVSWEVTKAISYMFLIPYNSESNNILKLTNKLSYRITDRNRVQFDVSLLPIPKNFYKYITKQNKEAVKKNLLNHLNDIKTINLDDIHPNSKSRVKGRISDYEKLIASINTKQNDDISNTLTFSVEYKDFDKVLSELKLDNRAPMFHANPPTSGDAFELYRSSLINGLFSKNFEKHGLNFKLGLSYRDLDYPVYLKNSEVFYLLLNNKSPQDFIVSANFKFINAKGYTINEVDLSNEYIINEIENAVIGTVLNNSNRLAKDLKITLTLKDHSDFQPEVRLFKRTFVNPEKTNKNAHAYDMQSFHALSNDFPEKYKVFLELNKDKLIFDKTTKRACADKYNIKVSKYSSSNNPDDYLLYSAFCSDRGGECSYGHENEVLYKIIKTDKHEEISEILRLNHNGGSYHNIQEIYDINNDGEIELSILDNYCLSSTSTIKKIINDKLIILINGTEHSEGGYRAEPMHKTNPFVFSQM